MLSRNLLVGALLLSIMGLQAGDTTQGQKELCPKREKKVCVRKPRKACMPKKCEIPTKPHCEKKEPKKCEPKQCKPHCTKKECPKHKHQCRCKHHDEHHDKGIKA